MTEIDTLVENLIETDGIHAFVFICEVADKYYFPMVDSIVVPLANGKSAKVSQIEPDVRHKVEETRRAMRRGDRIVWALRFYKKSLLEELLWLVEHDPGFFQKKFGAPPAPEQAAQPPGHEQAPQNHSGGAASYLRQQLQKLSSVDITPFVDPAWDPDGDKPPYTGYSTIDAINSSLGRYMEIIDTSGENEPDNPIQRLIFQHQSFGEIISMFRRGEIILKKKYAPGIKITPDPAPDHDMRDEEGPIKTVLGLSNGWRWFDLMRQCSQIRNDPRAAPAFAITGHCANTATPSSATTILELAEPLGNNRWRHHAMFVVQKGGLLGEMKGRKNQKPSPRLWKAIVELLLKTPWIKGLVGAGYNPDNNFRLCDLPKFYLDKLKEERPDIFVNSVPSQLTKSTLGE